MTWFQQSWIRVPFREIRAAPAKFFFVVVAVAIGVGALTGVRGFSEAFRGMLLRDARTLMAADLMIRVFDPPNAEQTAEMESLEARGVERTRITETVSMVSSERVRTPVLSEVKAVDPAVYPFYGELRLRPPEPLKTLLTADSVLVSDDLLLRLEANVGDSVTLGEEEFRIAGVVTLEPDRMTGSVNVGPRIMVSREGLERSGLVQVGSRTSERFLFRIPPETVPVALARTELEGVFERGLITDYRESHPLITRGLDRATTFLSLVSLIALVVGALGVATSMHSHLQQRMDTIAVMKCLGARSGQIMRIYLLQTLLLGLAGGVAGVVLGFGVQAVFPSLIERYFQIRPPLALNLAAALQGLSVGILATLLFTLPPLLGIRDIRPAAIFRRDMMEAPKSWRERWLGLRASVFAGGLILLGIGAVTVWLSGDARNALRTGVYFLGGLTVTLALLFAVSWGLLRSLRVVLRRSPVRLPATLRHGAANLYRPGNHAETVLVALGVGVMFTFTVYLVQHGLLQEIVRSAPPDMPNVFLVNITDREREGIEELLKRQPGVIGDAGVYASAEATVVSVNDAPFEPARGEGRRWRNRREREVTWLAEKPDGLVVTDGAWWDPAQVNGSEAQLCVAVDEARWLGVRPGDVVEWTAAGKTIRSKVACIHDVEEVRFGADREFVFSPGALDGVPVTYFGGVRVEPDAVAALQREAHQLYPTVTVINAAEVLEIVQGVIDQVAIVVRFVSLFAILAGVIILAASVAGSRFRRIREAAILKTVGATRGRVIAIFSLEFFILGSVAGVVGTALATGFSGILLNRLLEAPLRVDTVAAIAAVVLTALVAVSAGWLASYRILGQKPLEVLRNE